MSPHEEFVRRAKEAGQPPLAYLHHHVMDQIYSGRTDGFSFNDIYTEAAVDPILRDNAGMAEYPPRIRLVVIRALEGLVAVEMLREESSSEGKRYFFGQYPPSENSQERLDQ
jgi:hypothetical protein